MNALRDTIAGLYRAVCARGLVVGSSGNVSARTEGGMLITPTGVRGDVVAPGELVAMDFDGNVASDLTPSSEWRMHAAIFRAAPAAMVIIHTHSDAATALGSLHLPLPAFHYDIAQFGGNDVRLAPYALFGSEELVAHAVRALAGRSACLLANHGMICHGTDAATALQAAVRLETMARQYLLALAAGTPKLLSPTQMAAVHTRYTTYGQQPKPKRTLT